MTSVLSLEASGRWRVGTVLVVAFLASMPIVPLLGRSLEPGAPALGPVFWGSLWTSAGVAAGAATIGVLVGLPLGVFAALHEFPGRKALLVTAALPLLVPSFLWAIGWSELAARVPGAPAMLRGTSGCVLVFATMVAPLVLLVSFAASTSLSRSQVDGARLAGGETRVLRLASRHAIVPALLAAALGGIVTLADAGAGEILGVPMVATELLTSFAARYDVQLAARQCLVLTGLVLLAAAPVAWVAGRRLADAALARQTAPFPRQLAGMGATASLALLVLISVLLPLAGLLLPVVSGPWSLAAEAVELTRDNWRRNHFTLLVMGAFGTVARTAANTLVYAAGAGLVATLLGFGLACAAGRSGTLRTIALVVALALFAWPPAAGALGAATMATASPAWLDPILRSRFTVCAILGLRLFAVGTVLGLRAWGTMAPSWAYAAAVHGVPPRRYLWRVVWPSLRPSAALSMLVVSLLASADVGTVLLLHPPGADSLPLTIFTVMANAPTTTVVSLCLLYLFGAFALLLVLVHLAARRP